MPSSSSLHSSDLEKLHIAQPVNKSSSADRLTLGLRLAQYVIFITALVIAACALDRSLTSFKWFSDEVSVIAGTILALIYLPLTLHIPIQPTASTIADTLLSALLFAAFILSTVNQGKDIGSCDGPDMIGVFDNKRACRKMMGTLVLVVNDGVMFATSAGVGWKKRF